MCSHKPIEWDEVIATEDGKLIGKTAEGCFLVVMEDMMSMQEALSSGEWTDPFDGHVLTEQEIREVVHDRNRVIRDSILRAKRAARAIGEEYSCREALLYAAAVIRLHNLVEQHRATPETFERVIGGAK